MSFLVEMPTNEYPRDALSSFRVTSAFDVGNARAMMWLSQVAYETNSEQKVRDILGFWGLTARKVIFNAPDVPPLLRKACAVVAGGRGATFVSFAGTDPLKINDWITDVRTLPSSNGVHRGFEEAVGKVWPDITAVIAARPDSEKDLFFTGHSLGGVLAIIAAHRALGDPGLLGRATATAVYTFGSPRPGGRAFFDSYTPALGEVTYRLVHGADLVATVPPSTGLFRHVGRCIQCNSGQRFDSQTPVLTASDDKPAFIESVVSGALNKFRTLMTGRLFTRVGPGLLGLLSGLLPRQIRDHFPQSYFAALPPR